LTDTDRALSAKILMEGIIREGTMLSDTYIQSSVASTIEYLSKTIDVLAKIDKTILSDLTDTFARITIMENN
jgi:hypothetical protein